MVYLFYFTSWPHLSWNNFFSLLKVVYFYSVCPIVQFPITYVIIAKLGRVMQKRILPIVSYSHNGHFPSFAQ